ncbi:MAG: RsmE family RNA methyltransferase [Rectinema sp.]|jgi:RsmE family RNA methyltransferase
MNLCILNSSDMLQSLSRKDRRAQHILEVLKKKAGDRFRAGSTDGLVGWASLESITDERIVLRFIAEHPAPPLRPVRVMLGTVRPIQAARIVKELTTLGVSSIAFFPTELGEKSYTQSNFYVQKEYYMHAQDGAEQAGNPRLPEIDLVWSLKKALEQVEHIEASEFTAPLQQADGLQSVDGTLSPRTTKIVCHPDCAATPLSHMSLSGTPVILAIGTERGWTEHELEQFLQSGFALCALGDRILKTETAAAVAVSVVLARLGYF